MQIYETINKKTKNRKAKEKKINRKRKYERIEQKKDKPLGPPGSDVADAWNEQAGKNIQKCACVFFTIINRSFYPSTSGTTSVRAVSSILEEVQLLWSQRHATEILRCQVCSKDSCGQCNALFIILDTTGTTYTFYKKRNKSEQSKRKQKKTNRKGERKQQQQQQRQQQSVVPPPPPAGGGANT